MSAVESIRQLDGAAAATQHAVRRILRDERVANLLRGSWLGHPVHPLMVQVPIGSWISAAVLDTVPAHERAARTLVGFGLLAVAPTVVTGAADLIELDARQRRVATVHAVANIAASGSYLASYACRVRGARGAGRRWALLGMAAVAAGGALGGHLSYSLGAGVDRWSR